MAPVPTLNPCAQIKKENEVCNKTLQYDRTDIVLMGCCHPKGERAFVPASGGGGAERAGRIIIAPVDTTVVRCPEVGEDGCGMRGGEGGQMHTIIARPFGMTHHFKVRAPRKGSVVGVFVLAVLPGDLFVAHRGVIGRRAGRIGS